jgi:hypothetical protein
MVKRNTPETEEKITKYDQMSDSSHGGPDAG